MYIHINIYVHTYIDIYIYKYRVGSCAALAGLCPGALQELGGLEVLQDWLADRKEVRRAQ